MIINKLFRYVTDIDWSNSDSPKLASTSMDSDLKIWKLETGKLESEYSIKSYGRVNLVSYSQLIKWANDHEIATTVDGGMRIQIMDTKLKKQSSVAGYNLTTGRSGPSGQTKAIDFNNDNHMMVLVNYPGSTNYNTPSSVIKVFDRRLVKP